jgi:glycosyltransferase involved in cell wall biosynthesis
MSKPNQLAIVVPCYNEEEMLPITAEALRVSLDDLTKKGLISADSFVLFVDDGSKDKTWELISAEHDKTPTSIYGLKLAGNVGHQFALTAGLLTAMECSDVTISIDADLQDDIHVFDEMLQKYQDKEFKNISAGDLGLESDEDKTALDEKNAAAKDLLAEMEKALEGKVKAVRLSNRLKSHAVCLSSDGDLSLEMEKVLNTMPTGRKVQAERVLELNPEHPVFVKLESLLNDDKEKLAQYAELLYQQALLIEGLPVEDPVALSKMICDLMV